MGTERRGGGTRQRAEAEEAAAAGVLFLGRRLFVLMYAVRIALVAGMVRHAMLRRYGHL